MGDVSDYVSPEAQDLQTIMTGGANWMARMEAFQTAKERAEKAIADAKLVGEIVALRAEAESYRDKAKAAMDTATETADSVVKTARQSANDILASAKEAAKKLVDEATTRSAAIDGRSNATFANAQDKLAEANALMSKSLTRASQLDAYSEAINNRASEAAKAQAEATAAKERFEALTQKVLALTKQVGEMSAQQP